MPRRMPREGRRGCSGTCPAHLGKDPRRSPPPGAFSTPPGRGEGVGAVGQGPAEPGGLGHGPSAAPCSGGCSGGVAAGSPRVPHPSHPHRGGVVEALSACPPLPKTQIFWSPVAFSPGTKLNFSPLRKRLQRCNLSLITPPTGHPDPPGGVIPLPRCPSASPGLEAFANFSCSR